MNISFPSRRRILSSFGRYTSQISLIQSYARYNLTPSLKFSTNTNNIDEDSSKSTRFSNRTKKPEEKASLLVRFFASWIRISNILGTLLILGLGASYFGGVLHPVWERMLKMGSKIDPAEPVDIKSEDVNPIIELAFDKLKGQPEQLKIIGEPVTLFLDGGMARGYERPSITLIYNEKNQLIQKLITGAISGSQRQGFLETCLSLNDKGEWWVKDIFLKIPGQYQACLFKNEGLQFVQ